MDILFTVVGLVLLFAGGEAMLRGSVAIATRLQLSTLFVSMVIVGFGTSAPEFLVSILAAVGGAPNLAMGNVVGSNVANILLILGLSAAIFPVTCNRKEVLRDGYAVTIASLLTTGVVMMGVIPRWAGGVMLVSLIGYLYYAYTAERDTKKTNEELEEHIKEDVAAEGMSLTKGVLFAVAGLVGLAGGAQLLVKGATSLAEAMGVSNAVIGLTLVAVGTSLPELATATVAAFRKHADVVIGNVLGSNLFNLLGVLGATALVTPIPVEARIISTDIWIMLGTAVVLVPVIFTGRRVSRGEGIVFLIAYVAYTTWVYTSGS